MPGLTLQHSMQGLLGESDVADADLLILEPRKRRARKRIESLRIYVDRSTGLPVRLVSSSADGGSREIVLHDVTAMRRLETLRSTFVANVSHEMRTPVAVIQANAEALKDGALHDEERSPFLPRLWAQRKVAFLLDAIRLHGEEEELKEETIRLSKEDAIMTQYTW